MVNSKGASKVWDHSKDKALGYISATSDLKKSWKAQYLFQYGTAAYASSVQKKRWMNFRGLCTLDYWILKNKLNLVFLDNLD